MSGAERDIPRPPNAPRPHVLIVADDPVFALLAGESLGQAAFTTATANGIEKAMALFNGEHPDLVLLDVELPGSGGFDCCAQIRAAAGGLDVPIIMVTGRNGTQSLTRAYEVGASDCLTKPIPWPTLPHRIEFMLRARNDMRALRAREQKNAALLQALPDSLYIVARDGIILDCIAGDDLPAHESLIRQPLEHIVPADVARGMKLAMAAAPGSPQIMSYEFQNGADDPRAFEARLRPQADDTFLIIMRDATERRRAEARIEYLAYYDMLTGLPNRQLFVRDLARAIASAQRTGHRIGLLYLDLDRFKRINDNLGHSIGDALLRGVSRRLEQSLRVSDVIAVPDEACDGTATCVARLGGDEFVILLADVKDANQVTIITHRIQQALGEPFDCEGHSFVVTPSIGIAMFPEDGTDIEDLLVKADMAMYRAKDQGRNGYSFYGESLTIRSRGRLELENDMRRAIDTEDFELYYQPKLDVATGTIVGVEALLRWEHATHGAIPPGKFIPVAEETGMIVVLGDWVIRESCRQINAWANSALAHLSVAVNVSAQQFAKKGFVEKVRGHLRQYGVKPRQLELEITESLLMSNVESTVTSLKALGAAGLALSIDDFGTGYSSLGYLRQFQVDALKIDRAFIKDLPASNDSAAICSAIIAMARELKLKVVAEGVETPAQLDFLRRHRCNQAQGYLIGRPVSAAHLPALIDRDRQPLSGDPVETAAP